MANAFDQFDTQANPFDQFDAVKPPIPANNNDAALSALGGIEKGAVALPMILPNLINQAVAGPQELYRGLTGRNNDNSPLWQPFYGSEDVINALPKSVQPHQPTTGWGVASDIAGQFLGNIAAGKAMVAPFNPKPNISAEDLRAKASGMYQAADQAGGSLKPNVTNSFLDNATSTALPTAPRVKALVGNTPSAQIMEGLQSWRDTPMTLQETQDLDKHLGDLIDNNVDPATGKVTAEGNNLLKIQQALRDSWQNATPNDTIGGSQGFESAKTARQLWAASAKANDVERIINRAQMMDNPTTGLKTGFRTLANNPSRLRGFTPDEVKAIKTAANTGIVSNALRFASSGLVPIIAGVTGGLETGGIGYGVSQAAKAGANAIQNAKANAVLQAILKRPVVQGAFPNPQTNLSIPAVGAMPFSLSPNQ